MKTNNPVPASGPLARLTINLKLWGILVFFLIVMILSAVATYAGIVKISRYLDSGEVETLRHAVSLRNNLNDVEQNLNDAAAQRDFDMLFQARRTAKEFDDHLHRLMEIDTINEKEYLKLEKMFHEYYVAGDAAALLLLQENAFSPKLRENAEKVRSTLPILREGVDSLIDSRYAIFERMISLSSKEASSIIMQVTLLLFLLAIIGVLLVFRTIQSIIKPINRLVDATKELGAGNLAIRTAIDSNDEIGDLAHSFNAMADRLEEMRKEIIKNNEELKEANDLLQKADKAKSEFLASMSHELRTPLNAMINFTDQVIEDWEELKANDEWHAEAKGMLVRVLGSSRHLLDLINDLLDLAKIESGKMGLDIEEVDLADIVEDCVISLDSLAKKKNIPLITRLDETEYPARCDRRKVKQIVLNLLSNAIKFTDAGHVKTTLRKDATVYTDGYLIEVEDTGIGIPEEYHQRVFDRFQQVDSSDSRKHAGTGLGLNLVKELAEMHGGTVTLKSVPEKGSTFTVRLPFKAKEPKISQP
ncbi:MAG: HAMP domain-containing histidine kinase [Nitrospinae bacterium]|nr:HAMP domain-containing histidine kinase [Nitrospinota bacterium]